MQRVRNFTSKQAKIATKDALQLSSIPQTKRTSTEQSRHDQKKKQRSKSAWKLQPLLLHSVIYLEKEKETTTIKKEKDIDNGQGNGDGNGNHGNGNHGNGNDGSNGMFTQQLEEMAAVLIARQWTMAVAMAMDNGQ